MENLLLNTNNSLPFKAFKDFTDSYTRATEIICKDFNLTTKQAFYRVRENSKRWQNFKTVVKLCDIDMRSKTKWPKAERKVIKWAKKVGLLNLYYTPDYQKLRFLYETSYFPKK
jgi:hypothetical protein